MDERRKATLEFLAKHREIFDRLTKDGTGGRVAFGTRMPRSYDNRQCLPWSDVVGRYWYPRWKDR